jgi:hypothetical protein
MHRACKIVVGAFLLLYLAALLVLAAGTFGLFGAERDPLSGIYVLVLGLPWNRLIDVFPGASQPWLAAGAPLLNLPILWAICRALHAYRSDRQRA